VNQNGELFEECYNFDSNRKQIYSKILPGKQTLKQDTLPLQKDIFDFLSASQFIRHLKFENMKQGNRIPFKILIDNKLYPLYIKYSGIERINLPNRNSYVCYKIAVQVIEGEVFKGGEALTAWISADSKRLPVLCEAKIQVGLVKATLSEVKYPTAQLLSIKSTIN
jgi:hypothetical protein